MSLNLTKCQWCGGMHSTVCPMVKAIDYYESGSIKRVEFKTPADYGPPVGLGGYHTQVLPATIGENK